MPKFTIKENKLFFLFLLLIISVSCRSDDKDDSKEMQYYLKANFNGQPKIYQSIFSSGYSTYGGGTQPTSINFQYNLSAKDGSPYPGVYIGISANSALSVGTYSEQFSAIDFEYRKSQTNFSTASKFLADDFTITILEYDGKTIKGTFSGTIQNDSGEKIVVDKGEFYGYAR